MTSSHFQKSVAKFLAIFCIFSSSSFGTSSATAYSLTGCKWPTASITWSNEGTSTYRTAASAAISSWNSAVPVLNLSALPAGYGSDVRVFEAASGPTSYDGVTIFTCSSGVIQSSISRWNTYFTSAYSAAKKKQVMVHELGHSFGLDHSGSSACSGQPIMYPNSSRFSLCGHQDPQTDDVNGINYLY